MSNYTRSTRPLLITLSGLLVILFAFVSIQRSVAFAQRSGGVEGGTDLTCGYQGQSCCIADSTSGTSQHFICRNGLVCNTTTQTCGAPQQPAPSIQPQAVTPTITPTLPGQGTISPTPISLTPAVIDDRCVNGKSPVCPDANGDAQISLLDFEIWRQEFRGEVSTKRADFDLNNKVDLVDFELWRRVFFGNSQGGPTTIPSNTTPTKPPVQVTQPPINVNCTITGTEGPDDILGTAGDDVICALGGDDRIAAGAGNDVIHAGSGRDSIAAEGGNDTIYTDDGEVDRVDGGPGSNQCRSDSVDQVVNCVKM